MGINTELADTALPDLALIGAGYWGKNLARNFHAIGVLHTLCDANKKTLDTYGSEYEGVRKLLSFEAVLADPAITKVAIATPAVTHFTLIKSALEAGKDVFVEKPLCLDVAEGEELVALAQYTGRILMVGHLLQYHPCIQRLQQLVAQGDLGRIQYITSNRLNLGKIRSEENSLWSFAPHDLSVILSLVGDQVPEQVQCNGGSYLNQGIADTTLTTLKFGGGVRAHVFVSWLHPFKEQKLTVVGSDGMAVFDDTLPWEEKLVLYREHITWANGNTPTPCKVVGQKLKVLQSEPLRDECEHFLECCLNGLTPRTDGAEGLRVLRLLEAAERSLQLDSEAINPRVHESLCKAQESASSSTVDYYVHPTATIDQNSKIGNHSKIWHYTHVSSESCIGSGCNLGQNCFVGPGVRVGNNVKIQNNVSLYTGTIIEDDVFLGPSCVLTNVKNPRSQINRHSIYEKTVIKKGATIGANVTIVCGVVIGKYAFVAAGAVITKDIADYELYAGNPGKKIGWMSRHGHILENTNSEGFFVCPESGFRYSVSSSGVLRCNDLPEDDPLPDNMQTGRFSYQQFKAGEVL